MKLALHSIGVRLTLLYAVLGFGILAFATIALYWAMTNSIHQDDERYLAEKIHVLRTMLRERPDDKALLDEEVKWETGVLPHAQYFVAVSTPDNRIVSKTPGMATEGIHLSDFPAPIAISQRTPVPRRFRTPSGQSYLLASAYARLGQAHSPSRIVRLAVNVSHEDLIFTHFRQIAWVVLVAGSLLSALMGAWVARRGLRPLSRLGQSMAGMTVSALDEPLYEGNWPAELRPLVTEFNRMLTRLGQSFDRLSEFSADLAHEFRTPLNNLRGQAEVALSRVRTAEGYREVILSMLEECDRLTHMTDSLLLIARNTLPDASLKRERFCFETELEDILDYFDAVAEEQHIALTAVGEGELEIDRGLFRRAINNLLSNALRHTPSGGRVTVRLKDHGAAGIAIEVVDTGCGIPEDLQSRLFQRFSRVDPAGAKGTGLGLALVKSIVELHGGTIDLISTPGRGTQVCLCFPPHGLDIATA